MAIGQRHQWKGIDLMQKHSIGAIEVDVWQKQEGYQHRIHRKGSQNA